MQRGKHGKHPCGPDHARWASGKLFASSGYVKLRVGKSHPLADANGYAYEHLVTWCAAGRDRPPTGFLIHHKNEDKTDNRLDNLELKTRPSHSQNHNNAITDDQVRSIREAYARGEADMPALAARYFVPCQRIARFVAGETRRGAGGPIIIGDKRRTGTMASGALPGAAPTVARAAA